LQPALPRRRAPKATTGSKPALSENRSGQGDPPVSPTRLPGTTGRCPRDGSSSPNDHADAISGVVTPSRVCRLWLPKPVDRPFWPSSAPGTLPTQTAERRRASKKLRFQVIANISPTSLSFPDSRRASNRGYVRDGSLVDIGNRWLFVDIVLTAASPGLDPNRGLPGSLHGTFPHGADRRCALHRRCD